jgi:dTDP-4-amino-4,6-dideoxygalactose transaminase
MSDEEVAAVAEVVKAGVWLSSGPKTKEFEENFAKTVGAEAALALNSATAGLHLALAVHGIGKDDEVLTTPMTFCATANVAEHLGAKVNMADVEPDTLLIDPKGVEKKITKKTRAIIPVHYAGHGCDMKKLNALAKSADAAMIEDAAHCMPSKIDGKWIGSAANLTAFSFYANKNMTTGEGGMLTGAKDLIDQCRVLALHGMTRNAWDRFSKGGTWKYDVPAPGYKYNMTDAAAAMGVVQLRRLDELYRRRMQMVDFYEKAFAGSEFITPLKVKPGYQSSHHLYVVFLNLEKLSLDRDAFIVQMTERNIGTSVHYTPVHMLSYYAKKYGWKPESFPNAWRAFNRMVSIPLSSALTVKDAEDVVQAMEDICRKFKK